jgi:hypothetical protein
MVSIYTLQDKKDKKGWLSKDKISLRIEFDSPRIWDVTFEGFLLPIGEWSVNQERESRPLSLIAS